MLAYFAEIARGEVMFWKKRQKPQRAPAPVVVRTAGYVGVERRRRHRRLVNERRDLIRWPAQDRRQNAGRRATDAPWAYR